MITFVETSFYMRERIIKFLTAENISSAKFADEIGVQRSSVSHILSGRNNPGFDFIQKILTRYKNLNAEWLIMGTGNMIKTMRQGNLFDELMPAETKKSTVEESDIKDENIIEAQSTNIHINTNALTSENEVKANVLENLNQNKSKQIEKVLIFYTDKTFTSYLPEN